MSFYSYEKNNEVMNKNYDSIIDNFKQNDFSIGSKIMQKNLGIQLAGHLDLLAFFESSLNLTLWDRLPTELLMTLVSTLAYLYKVPVGILGFC